ncbi:DUF373 family protein [Candidatus Micrarchaeota archaeon]|nr:DUF373 family protein [Candidatus Micrarchaeota archaeon]
MQRPILILCIDRDNDLYEKARVTAPVVGREKNITAATKLALADPEDPDSNAIFSAVKIYDQLKKEGKTAEIITLTGHKNLGYTADKAISTQLDRVINEIHPTSAILVTDGMADEEILPIVKSRIKIDSTKIVFIKQAKELEKTYFVLIEKLRDPHYARILLGIPAIILILVSISRILGYGIEPVGVLIGVYLLLKVAGVEDLVLRIARDFRFSIFTVSWISYIVGFTLSLIGLLIGNQLFSEGIKLGLSGEKLIAYIIVKHAVTLVYFGSLLIIAGKFIDALTEKKKFTITKYSLYAVAATLGILVVYVGAKWVANLEPPYVSFGEFLFTLIAAIFVGYISTRIIKDLRTNILVNMRLDGKEVINEYGSYIGKIIGVSGSDNTIIVQTMFEKRYALPISSVSSIGDNIIVRGIE